MTLEIILLITAVALRILVTSFSAFGFFAKAIAWPLAVFLTATVCVDFFWNVPRFVARDTVGSQSQIDTQKWQRRYVLVIGISLFLRLVTVLLLVQWFLFPSIHIFSLRGAT